MATDQRATLEHAFALKLLCSYSDLHLSSCSENVLFQMLCQSTTGNQVAFKHADDNSVVPHSSAEFLSLKVSNVLRYEVKQSLNRRTHVLYSEITVLI